MEITETRYPVWMVMEPLADKPGWYGPTYRTEEPDSWNTKYSVPDPESFADHMARYDAIPRVALTREQYEALCNEWGVEPVSDAEMGQYGDNHGDYGMSHYHTVPQNRLTGVAATLCQRRWWAVRDEREVAAANVPTEESAAQPERPSWAARGIRYDEACDRCGTVGEVDNATDCCRGCY